MSAPLTIADLDKAIQAVDPPTHFRANRETIRSAGFVASAVAFEGICKAAGVRPEDVPHTVYADDMVHVPGEDALAILEPPGGSPPP